MLELEEHQLLSDERTGQEYNVSFPGKIPIDIQIREAGDAGHPFIGKKTIRLP
ncbi:MAG: hypothetical protein V1862_10335 [Methanobacteriota archaeon]